MQVGSSGGNIVRWKRGDGEVKATFEVMGRFLVLTAPDGVHRTALGLQNPRKLACRMLNNICVKASSIPSAAAVPAPAIIAAIAPAEAIGAEAQATLSTTA